MKKINLSSSVSALVLAAGLFAATFQAAGQSVLIKVYTWDPSNVRFVAQAANASANASVDIAYGVDLIKFFTSTPAPGITGGFVNGNLIPAGTNFAYNAWETDNLLSLGKYVDLNLYTTGTSATQVFSTATRAFNNNTATINLSSFLAYLPAVGATGNIYSGDVNATGQNWLIGTWVVVVPEPSVEAQLALGAMVLAGLAFIRRTRRVSASR